MKILIKNATLVSMDENREKIEFNIDLLINNDKIEKIDHNINENCDKVINAKENVVMPGLINCHCHTPMSLFRETGDGYITQEWLEKKIWPREATLTKKDIYNYSKLSIKEMIQTGTTMVNDMYFYPEETIKAAKELGFRMQLTDFLMEQNGEKRIKSLEKLIKKYNNDSLISINVGLHSFYTSSKDYALKAIDLARKNDLNLHVHFLENAKEKEELKNTYYEDPINILKNVKGVNTILAHGVKLDRNDLEKISNMNISIASCPISNLKLGCGIADLKDMLELNINVCLGTDGQGSGCNLDMFEEMKFASLLQKGIYEDPKILNAYDVLKMATINGAKALRTDKEIGSISLNKKADLILIDMRSILTTPTNDVISELVYNIKGSNVLMTMINGKVVYVK